MADEEPSLEQMEMKARLYVQKMGGILLRSVWLYFGVPPEYIEKIRVLNNKPFDKEFTHFISKAAVVDILRNRDLHGLLFEIIFRRCITLGNDVLVELDIIIGSLISNHDPFSAFIRFCAILSDFVLFMRCKGNFLNLGRQRLHDYWEVYYKVYFDEKITHHGGLEALKNAARNKACIYPYCVLRNFTSKYCGPGADYNKENIPTYFEEIIHKKYQRFNYNFY